MNLPAFHELKPKQGSYLTFTKALLDFDYANSITNSTYYFTKMVALNLPNYVDGGDFYADVTSMGIVDKSPNITVPKIMQFYLENILRQIEHENITELAFWKTLKKMGLNQQQIDESIVFINEVAIESFTLVENNNGWCEVVCEIPNSSKNLIKKYKTVDIPDVVIATDGNTDGMFDNGNKEFLFEDKQVIDFSKITYESGDIKDFDFNVLLMFYKDKDGVDKLHGINFLNDFNNEVTHWEIPRYTKTTNDYKSIGYQFKLNMKTVNNEANLILIEQQNFDSAHWNTYLKTLSQLNSIIDYQNRNLRIDNAKI